MSIYIGNNNNFEDRLKALEAENKNHRVVHEIDHMSDLHVNSSFYKQSMEIDNYFKIHELARFINRPIDSDSTIG